MRLRCGARKFLKPGWGGVRWDRPNFSRFGAFGASAQQLLLMLHFEIWYGVFAVVVVANFKSQERGFGTKFGDEKRK